MTKRHRSGGNYTKTQSDICRAKLKIRIRDQDQPEQQNGATQQEQADATSSWLNLPISMVSSAVETRTYPTTCGEVLEGIRSGKWEKLVKRVSSGYAKAFETAVEEGKPDPAVAAKKAVHTKKRELPAVTWSGAFSERVDSAIESHSGLLCVDVDNCQDPADIRAKLANDPYIQAAFISPTGTGCKALVRIPPQAVAHAQSFAAARKHFKEAHNVTIDEACKNLSRLCYIAHDADAFIRNEEAEILEPLPLEKPEAPKRETEQEEDVIPAGLMKLPEAGLVTNSESAESIFNKILEQEPPVMYLRAGRVVTIEEKNQLDGKSEVVIEDLSPAAFRSAVEKCGTLFAYYAPRGQLLIKPKALMSADIANVLLASEERKRLPPVWLIHRCPILVEKDGESFLLGKGYHREFGGRYIACGGEIDIKIPLDQAVDALLELFEEFDFVTRADKARAVTSMIMPALRFGGLLRCHFPALLVEADHSQAGKGTLVEMNQLVYNERAGMAPKRQRGVGSFDEDLSAKMLEGRVFIQPDNIRSALNSEFFESCLTCPPNTTILARVPYRAGVEVDPNKHIFHLTSNKFEATQDLANRSCVVRIKKRSGHKWKKFSDGRRLLAHIEANPWRYLSAVYSIAAQWVARGKQSNEDELRGEGRFREYWQVADWFAQKIFELPHVLDNHDKIQQRVASAAQSWVRSMGILMQARGLFGKEVSATRLVEIANEADDAESVAIPGVLPEAEDDDKAKRVGLLMKQVFKDASTVEIDTLKIERIQWEEETEKHGLKSRKSYVFSQTEATPKGFPKSRGKATSQVEGSEQANDDFPV